MDTRRSTYNFQKATLGEEAEWLRLREQALMGWEKEFRTLQWFGLEDGMTVLEAGSGPGFVTEQLLERLPTIRLTSLDIDETLLNKAKHRLSHIPEFKLAFKHASVYETGLPDNQFDFAVARLLFLHLHDPVQAAMEMKRVLKPGGKLVIIDLDDGIFGAIQPDLEALPSILQKIAKLQASKGGNRHIGRSLPRLLTESGFTDPDIEAVIQHSDLHGIEGFKRQLDIDRFTVFYTNGIISKTEYEEMKQACDRFAHSPEAHAMFVLLMACGTKPSHT
ncbi:methyltransferase domain-containing protein [Paenibacillus silvisoli]|uniref:methyltransferase domain-containing protein n=1 Tax=Paenibacillus silvisoli TaxID=3110539 RepID=UPI002805D761|nr:methyltransferase domain-containing protein [Paenibacillus silvisoli]